MPREGLTSEIVTEAAAVIVDAHGAAALTLARLAANLRVAPPSLYKHIAGLDDLILRVSALSARRVADDLTSVALGRSGRQALLSVAEVYRRFAVEHAGLYGLTQTTLKHTSNAQQTEILRVFKIFEAVVRSYRVPDDLSIHAIRMIRAGLHGFTDIEVNGGFQMATSLDESFLFLVDALDTALRRISDVT